MKAVLIVDDEFDARRTIELLFELEGYEVTTAQNGEVALEKIAERKPQVILTDWMMPVMDGYELCARVRANPETTNIPIIMLTAVVSTMLAKEKLWDVMVPSLPPLRSCWHSSTSSHLTANDHIGSTKPASDKHNRRACLRLFLLERLGIGVSSNPRSRQDGGA